MPAEANATFPFPQSDLLAAAEAAPWLPGASARLAESGWALLERRLGISRAAYGTARVLARDAGGQRKVLAELALPAVFEQRTPVLLEWLPRIDAYARLGLRFADETSASTASAVSRLLDALDMVGNVGPLAAAVGGVLAAVHVIEAPDPEHDVSFSDPEVPFSVFLGMHKLTGENATVRLAEQLVHECMHLQLTLLEAVHPLVCGDAEAHWSPWQETRRPTRGVMHGLYVFKAVDVFLAELSRRGGLDGRDADHLYRRRREIGAEIKEAAASLRRSAELTPFGTAFLGALAGREGVPL